MATSGGKNGTARVVAIVPAGILAVTYTSISAHDTLQMYASLGQHMAFLEERADRDPEAMAALLAGMDKAYELMTDLTGQTPVHWGPTTVNDRATIASVPATCGAGCSYLGYTGMELLTSYGNHAYEYMRDSAALDGLLTYELGCNFWFYSGKLDYGPDWKLDSNGRMASWNGFFLPELLGLEYNPARVDSTRQRLHVMMERYLDDADWTWKKVVETNTSPKDPTWGERDEYCSSHSSRSSSSTSVERLSCEGSGTRRAPGRRPRANRML